MKTTIKTLLLALLLVTSCSKKVEEPPKPIPVKAQWTISNMGYLRTWNASVTIDQPIDEEVIITVEFLDFPANTPVSIPIKLPKGWVYWYGTSNVMPSSFTANAKPGSIKMSIKGKKQYSISY